MLLIKLNSALKMVALLEIASHLFPKVQHPLEPVVKRHDLQGVGGGEEDPVGLPVAQRDCGHNLCKYRTLRPNSWT
jgi:hypothetical protein